MLVAADNLINDATITRYNARELDELEFFHIKLERHDVIYAEGAPSETLLEVVKQQNCSISSWMSPCDDQKRTRARRCLGFRIRRGEIKWCCRSAISRLIDRRQQVDIIQDKLDARGNRTFAAIRTRVLESHAPRRWLARLIHDGADLGWQG